MGILTKYDKLFMVLGILLIIACFGFIITHMATKNEPDTIEYNGTTIALLGQTDSGVWAPDTPYVFANNFGNSARVEYMIPNDSYIPSLFRYMLVINDDEHGNFGLPIESPDKWNTIMVYGNRAGSRCYTIVAVNKTSNEERVQGYSGIGCNHNDYYNQS